MSDGHFNRSLLPSGGNYAAGVRAGEARMRTRALRALADALGATSDLTAQQRDDLQGAFRKALEE